MKLRDYMCTPPPEKKKQGGRGFTTEDSVDASIHRLEDCIEKPPESLVITRKQLTELQKPEHKNVKKNDSVDILSD